MVNVAGRSKACHNCRRRRVACDKIQPACDRCRKARLICEGYDRSLVIVQEDPKARQERRLIRTKSPQKSVPSEAVQSPRCLRPANHLTNEDCFELSHLMESLHVTDERAPTSRRPRFAWVFESDPSSTASISLRALAATFFGRMHAHEPSSLRGVTLYGQALKKLSVELSDPTVAPNMLHVLAALNLSMHELAVPTSGNAWSMHTHGVEYMISRRGIKPQLFQIEPAKSVFLRARSMIIVQAIRDRRRTFFEEHDWRTIPWAPDPAAKSSLDQIVDVLCFVPGIFEDKDQLVGSTLANGESEDAVTSFEELRDRVFSLLRKIYRFRWTWELSNPSVCYEVPEPRDSPFSPSVVHFTSLTRANEVTLYNATLIILLHLADELAVPLPNPVSLMVANGPLPPSTNPLRLPSHSDTPRTAALEICRSASYHLTDPTNMAGHYFLLFPLALARLEFTPSEPERLWIDQLLRQITEKGVFEAETVVDEVIRQTPDWHEPRKANGGFS